MSHVVVGRWGSSLAVRVPSEVARAAGLHDGEDVEIEAFGDDILIRRSAHRSRRQADARLAAAEIIADRKGHNLGDVTLEELRDEGRRG